MASSLLKILPHQMGVQKSGIVAKGAGHRQWIPGEVQRDCSMLHLYLMAPSHLPLTSRQVLPFSSVCLLPPSAPIIFSFYKQEENYSARVSFYANGSSESLFLLLCCPVMEVG